MLNILTARAEAEDQQDASGQAGKKEEKEEKVEAKEEQGKEGGGDKEEVHRKPGAAQALQQPAELQLRGVQHVRKEVQHQGRER